MTRIIGGRAGSLALTVPRSGTRPTSDRVRESLFGALDAADAVRGARVLDLYAGSGALGLEAASRGAASVDLVERAAAAASVARGNATSVAHAVGRAAAITVHPVAASAFLRDAPGPFDLVLLDPPYDLRDDQLAEVLEAIAAVIAERGTVIVERAARSAEPRWPAGLTPTRSRRYGDTALWWAQPTPASQSR